MLSFYLFFETMQCWSAEFKSFIFKSECW